MKMTIEQRIDQTLHRESQTIRYLLASACLKRFIPNIPEDSHTEFFRSVLRNQIYAWDDHLYADPVSSCRIIGESFIPHSPAIFCSFHISSYRMGLKYLGTRGFPITLVASDDVLRAQRETIQKVFTATSGGRPLGLIDANSSQSLLSMIHALRSGQSLFVYIDGNTGADGMSNTNANLFELPLLDSSLLVRKGVSVLSYLAKTPIIPLFTSRQGDNNFKITFFDPIMPRDGVARDSYIRASLLSLYHILEQQLLVAPDSWEAWLYIHKFVRPPREEENIDESINGCHKDKYTFNGERYSFYQRDDNDRYIFDTRMLQAYPMESELWDMLHTKNICAETIPQDLLKDLIKHRVIL